MNGPCYARGGPLRLQWAKVDREGVSFDAFLKLVADRLPPRQLWRYGQAGDLPPSSEDKLRLAKANRRRPVLCYTHQRDVDAFREAARLGFHVNLSADNLHEADELAATGLSVVAVLPSFYQRRAAENVGAFRQRIGGHLRLQTPGGRKVPICPATYADTNCSRCQVCARPRAGGTIIGFPAHGLQRKRLDARIGEPNGQ